MCFTMISIVATIRNRVSEFEKNKQTNKQTQYAGSQKKKETGRGVFEAVTKMISIN